MSISRRFFLQSSTLAAIAATVSLKPYSFGFAQTKTNTGYAIPLSAQEQSTYMFTKATFDPYVGGVFQTPDARGRMISLTLLSATQLKATGKISTATAVDTDSFSLMFKADRAVPPFTSIYKISHPALGDFDLFLTLHSDATAKSPIYEAVFNHI
jgi:hypothetical protein